MAYANVTGIRLRARLESKMWSPESSQSPGSLDHPPNSSTANASNSIGYLFDATHQKVGFRGQTLNFRVIWNHIFDNRLNDLGGLTSFGFIQLLRHSEICENLIIYIYFQNADLYKIIYDAFSQLFKMFKFLDCILESKNYP